MFVELDAGELAPPVRSRAAASRLTARQVIAALQPFLYLLPAFLSIGIWVYRPLIGTVELSFYEWNLLPTTPRIPVGWENYESVVTLPEMGKALKNTGIYVGGLIPFSVILPLAIAILVADIKGGSRAFYRGVIFLPVLMAPVVVAIIWRWMLHPTSGIVNDTLQGTIGVEPIGFLRSQSWAIWTIVMITAWKQLGFSVLLFSAGLSNISRDYIDAASVDGASRWRITRDIILPLLSPTIMFTLLLTILLSAQWTFPLINVLTQGGPLDSTTNIYYILYQFGFRNFNVGFSSAAAVMFFLAFGALALICTRVIDRYSFYDS